MGLLVIHPYKILDSFVECPNRTKFFRHGCKFLQVQKLEPWLVGGVKVAGGLDLISALARGLPVSEDFDLVIDIELLKAPPLSSKRLVMLIGVFSTANNFDRRMALRRSWMQYEAIRSGNVAVRFFIGLVSEHCQLAAMHLIVQICFSFSCISVRLCLNRNLTRLQFSIMNHSCPYVCAQKQILVH